MYKAFIILLFYTQIFSQLVHRFTGDRFTHYKIDDWISYGPALTITSIDMDENYIYFTTAGGGILRYDKYKNIWDFPFTTSSGLRSNVIEKIVYNPNDNFLYAKTEYGIDVYKPAQNFWRPGSNMPLPKKPDPQEVAGIKKRKDFRFPAYFRPDNDYLPPFFTDRTFIYHLDGVIFDRNNREFRFTDRITDMWQRLWIGTNGFGPLVADLFSHNLTSKQQSLPDISPRDIYIDGDYIWIGGIRKSELIGGITRWDRREDSWQYFEAQFIPWLSKDDVFAIDGNAKYILFATIDGLAIYDYRKDKWKVLNINDGLEGQQVYDVLIRGDYAFIGTESGFNWLQLSSLQLYESRNTILDNIEINQCAYYDNKVWLATRYGLYSIDINKDEIIFHPSSATFNDQYLTALEIINDEIWIANREGIAYWDYQNNSWHSYAALNMKYAIRDIESSNAVVWFATDKGLLKYDRMNNYWRIFTTEDGLISNNLYHLDLEGDILWISTAAGITLFYWNDEYRTD